MKKFLHSTPPPYTNFRLAKGLPRRSSAKAGFTLIELLVVVLIIGILAAIALPMYQKAVEKSKMAGVVQELAAVSASLDRFLLENGGFPQSVSFDMLSVIDVELTGGKLDTDGWYRRKDFQFIASCSATNCYVQALEAVKNSFGLTLQRKPGVSALEKICIANDKNGLKSCKIAEFFGFTTFNNVNELPCPPFCN